MCTLRWLLPLTIAGILGLNGVQASAAEPEERRSFYEDDAWYDISEWFDGNDYNPTDERWGVWDDETYDYADDLASTDQDSDWEYYNDQDYYDSYGDLGYPYGYADANEPSWFYDYYDDGYAWYRDYDDDGIYEKKSAYFDLDSDGLYDLLAISRDLDADGYFEVVRTYSFNDASRSGSDDQGSSRDSTATDGRSRGNRQQASRKQRIQGTVQRLKTVTVRDVPRQVASLQTQGERSVVVDLGPKEDLQDLNIRQGDRLTVEGPRVRVGNRRVVLAQRLETDSGDSRRIMRNDRRMRGNVASTRTVQVGGRQHTLAILEKDGQQVAVDLGPANRLEVEPKQGEQITVQGVPVKVRDRRMVIAQRATVGGTQVEIERGSAADGSGTSSQRDRSARTEQQQQQQQQSRQDTGGERR